MCEYAACTCICVESPAAVAGSMLVMELREECVIFA
jgi:hypothetical protein